jgi:hypothetical protein
MPDPVPQPETEPTLTTGSWRVPAAIVTFALAAFVLAGAAWWHGGVPSLAFAEPVSPGSRTHTLADARHAREGAAFFAPAEKLADLDDDITESSGVAASRTRPGWLWTHNDSGGGPWLYCLDPVTGVTERWSVRGAGHRDWEDMASFVLDDRPYLLVADTGDNHHRHPWVTLHVLPEPAAPGPGEPAVRAASPAPLLHTAVTLHLTYADGPRDCEAVAVDPSTRTVWLLSKEITHGGRMTGRSGLYRMTLPEPAAWAEADAETIGSAERPRVLERVATLDTVMPTAMDLSPDGRHLFIATYGGGLLFERIPQRDPDWRQAVAAGPEVVTLPPRRQGEAACFAADASAVYLTSEKKGQPIWRLPVNDRADR